MGMQEKISEGTVIINENSVNKYMYLVIKGTVALYVNYKKPDEYLLGLCNKGKVFGEMGLLCHGESYYTAVAETDVTVALFSEFELEHFIKGYPTQALGMMRAVARMNQVLNVNLKMIMEENKQYEKMNREMYMKAVSGSIEEAMLHEG